MASSGAQMLAEMSEQPRVLAPPGLSKVAMTP
jgi:hypothetical protein